MMKPLPPAEIDRRRHCRENGIVAPKKRDPLVVVDCNDCDDTGWAWLTAIEFRRTHWHRRGETKHVIVRAPIRFRAPCDCNAQRKTET